MPHAEDGGHHAEDGTAGTAGTEDEQPADEDWNAAAARTVAIPVLAGGKVSAGRSADDGGLGVVRIKPLGAGGGGGERSAQSAAGTSVGVTYSVQQAQITVAGSEFTYPSHVIAPDMDQQALYSHFMPPRVQAFLDGVNVNVMAYGQTGSGKTHTMFGPPGIMGRAADGQYGDDMCSDYGLFPRGVLEIFDAVERMRAAGAQAVLTASAVELSMMGNRDMLIDQAAVVREMGAVEGPRPPL